MKIKFYRSATLGLDFDGVKILTDPWLTDGEYYGSWAHYPHFDIEENLKELNSYDAIYISHIHPDHCSENTLKKLSKNIPVFIHKFHSPYLKFKIEKLGFKTIELDNARKHKIKNDTFITIYAADNCDPELCYKFTGCADLNVKNISQQIDTLAVIENKNDVIININDCPFALAKHPLKIIKKKYKDIRVLLTGYSGAGPYPQCYDNLNDNQKIIEADKKKLNFLNQALNFIDLLKPKYYLPCAGTYYLTGKLSSKQNLRGVPSAEESLIFIDEQLKKDINNKTKSIKIGPDQEFDLDNLENNSKYNPIDQKLQNKYVEEVLQKKTFNYEGNTIPTKEDIYELSKNAYKNFINKKIQQNSKIETDIIINFGEASLLLAFDKSEIELKDSTFISNREYIKLKIDARLLKLILLGPKNAHWNNAEIGSHINYYRSPNIYRRNLHTSLCYFHN